VTWHIDGGFEWDEAASEACLRRNGLDFHAASEIFRVNHLERQGEAVATITPLTATGLLRGSVLITVIYIEVGSRKRILDAFRADHEDTLDYMLTYGL
jgi:uncharacterized DUF497 family protein